METRGVVAEYDAGAEGLHADPVEPGRARAARHARGPILKVAPEKVRVVTGDVGGGFGTKTFMYREYPLAAEAARRLGRPVKWVADRGDHFQGDAQGRDNISVGEAALDADGRFLAMRFDILGNLGAYLVAVRSLHPLSRRDHDDRRLPHATRPRASARGLHQHRARSTPTAAPAGRRPPTSSSGWSTGSRARPASPRTSCAGATSSPADAMPYTTPIGDRTYDTGDFAAHMDRAIELAGLGGLRGAARQGSREAGGSAASGLPTYIECTAWGDGEESVVRLEKDGTATVYSGTQSNGQGHATAYAQFASQHLDLPLDKIRVVQGDTAEVATGDGTGGSRSIPVGGVSVFVGLREPGPQAQGARGRPARGRGRRPRDRGRRRSIAGTDRHITFAELAALPQATDEALKGEGDFTPPNATYPNGTHIAEVEIDPETGIVPIERYTICDDFGIAVNPLLLAGQVHGGVVQGIGQALLERTVYDSEGQLLTASLMDYCLPRAGRPAVLPLRDQERALDDQSARHQGRGRGRLDRLVPGGHERRRRRPRPRLRHPRHRHAGDAGAGLRGDPGRAAARSGAMRRPTAPCVALSQRGQPAPFARGMRARRPARDRIRVR